MIFYSGKMPKGLKIPEMKNKPPMPKVKPPKYKNKKVTIDGITFDSQLEATRYGELKLMERAGMIKDLKLQVEYVLIPPQKRSDGKKENKCSYIADFTYIDAITGEFVCEDTKGVKTKEYVIKRKLMLYTFGIEIKEVTNGKNR